MQFEVEQALNLDSARRVIPVLAEAKQGRKVLAVLR
jgi:hypothetical protein